MKLYVRYVKIKTNYIHTQSKWARKGKQNRSMFGPLFRWGKKTQVRWNRAKDFYHP